MPGPAAAGKRSPAQRQVDRACGAAEGLGERPEAAVARDVGALVSQQVEARLAAARALRE